MKKQLLQNGYVWVAVFAGILLLTQDYLYLNWTPKPFFLGLPNWLFWLMGIHVLLVVSFYFFTKKYW